MNIETYLIKKYGFTRHEAFIVANALHVAFDSNSLDTALSVSSWFFGMSDILENRTKSDYLFRLHFMVVDRVM